jgi:hypothetical protein
VADTLLGGGVSDAMLAHAARPNALPSLATLRLTNSARLFGTCLPALWAACPALGELYVAGATLLETSVRHFLAPRPSLRVNLLDDAPLPAAVDVTCGLCAAPLLRGLTSFAKAPPTQRHISEEWYTNDAPPEGASARMHAGDARMLNCARNCHAAYELYLIDAGTGAVALHGWRYGIAVGRGGRMPGRRNGPPLALVAPAAPPVAAAAAAAGAEAAARAPEQQHAQVQGA